MQIEKAIEIGQEILDGVQPTSITDRRGAIQLGLEALKREKLNRENPDYVIVGQLPGETK